MKSFGCRRFVRRLVCLSMLVLPAAAGRGQVVMNQLKVRDVTATAGAIGLVVPIDLLSQDQPLTFLSFDLTFDPALCTRLVDPAGRA